MTVATTSGIPPTKFGEIHERTPWVAPHLHPQEQAARQGALEAILKWGEWHAWMTLTFSADVSEETARRALLWWGKHLARQEFRDHFRLAWVLDAQSKGRLHFHVLMGFHHPMATTPPDPARALAVWRLAPRDLCTSREQNIAARFDAAGNAPAYTFLNHGGAEWAVACPRTGACKRALGCAVFRVGWRQ